MDRFFNTSCLVQQTPFRYGTSGRAVITGPGTIGIDLAARKNFAFLSEKLKAQFRAEFFNIANHAQFSKVDGNITDGVDFGRVTRARDPRLIQFALKLFF